MNEKNEMSFSLNTLHSYRGGSVGLSVLPNHTLTCGEAGNQTTYCTYLLMDN